MLEHPGERPVRGSLTGRKRIAQSLSGVTLAGSLLPGVYNIRTTFPGPLNPTKKRPDHNILWCRAGRDTISGLPGVDSNHCNGIQSPESYR